MQSVATSNGAAPGLHNSGQGQNAQPAQPDIQHFWLDRSVSVCDSAKTSTSLLQNAISGQLKEARKYAFTQLASRACTLSNMICCGVSNDLERAKQDRVLTALHVLSEKLKIEDYQQALIQSEEFVEALKYARLSGTFGDRKKKHLLITI